MNKLLLIFISILLICEVASAQSFINSDLKKINLLEATIIENHIDAQKVTPMVETRLPLIFIDKIDPEALFFMEDEVNYLTSLAREYKIPLNNSSTDFLNYTEKTLLISLTRAINILDHIGTQNFYETDSVLIDLKTKRISFTPDEESLKNRWIRSLKRNTLERTQNDSTLLSKSKSEINKELNKILKELIEIELCQIQLINITKETLHNYLLENFMGAIAESYDPHTNYFSIDLLSLFMGSLSGNSYSAGISFRKKEGKFLVDKIIPFSSASEYDNEIIKGDEITGLFMEGEFISPACLTSEELNIYFYGQLNDFINLEIKSAKDLKIRKFKLKKTETGNFDNHIFSYLLKGDQIKIGLIEFPVFYSDFMGDGKSSGQDLAKALLRLKSNDLNGLIIDLRNNGGGSVQEAIDLAGFFVDYGPLFFMTNTLSDKPSMKKDGKRGRLFNKKVMFLVNRASASASEIIAASMKNHPNVIIAGATTYGKSTGQNIFPLSLPDEKIPFGTVKITTSKIYDINGKSYQSHGVKPDIKLPDYYPNNLFGENLEETALIHDPLLKTVLPIKERSEPIEKLVALKDERIKNNKILKDLADNQRSLSDLIDSTFYMQLSVEKYQNLFTNLFKNHFIETAVSFEIEAQEKNEVFQNISNNRKKKHTEDPILNEAFRIFKDWINLNK